MDFYVPQNVMRILNILDENGHSAYLVGGCVRDSIMGKEPHDYDITTSASPEQICKCFKDFDVIETGIKHGTLTIVSDGENIEVTTYRIDGEYSDHRHPQSVIFSDKLNDDLSRRDFTINAMAYHPKTGVIDNFGGQKDLFKRKIVCVGEPSARFKEDALRIMRALRLASTMGFTIEYTTSLAVHELKNLLKCVSVERISSELDRLICGSSAADILMEYKDVISVIIPEIKKCIGFDQRNKFHVYDVWEHTANAIEHTINDRDVRLALLLHDIAKPDCYKQDEEGAGHFPSHEKIGADMAECVLKRMRYDNKTIHNVSELIRYHYVTPINDKSVVKQLMSILGTENFFKLVEVMKGDNSAKHSLCYSRVQTVSDMAITANEIIENNDCYCLKMLDISGNDLISLGLKGKAISDMLDYLLHEVFDERVSNENSKLIKYAKDYISHTDI